MGRKVTQKKRPTFFQLIHHSISTTEHMKIPPKFTEKHIGNDLCERATMKLERSSECSWSVKVRKSGKDVYFKEGWQEFVRDNSLGDKEFLVFIYDGKMRFSVRIFDKNGSKRMDQGSTVPNSTKKHSDRSRNCSKANSSAGKEVEEVADEDYSDNPAQQSAPKFTCTIYVPYKVRIRKSFAQDQHLCPGNYAVSLKNSKKKWVVKIVKSHGTFSFSAGWSAFAKASQIKFHDVCTFGLVSGTHFVVHICRK